MQPGAPLAPPLHRLPLCRRLGVVAAAQDRMPCKLHGRLKLERLSWRFSSRNAAEATHSKHRCTHGVLSSLHAEPKNSASAGSMTAAWAAVCETKGWDGLRSATVLRCWSQQSCRAACAPTTIALGFPRAQPQSARHLLPACGNRSAAAPTCARSEPSARVAGTECAAPPLPAAGSRQPAWTALSGPRGPT